MTARYVTCPVATPPRVACGKRCDIHRAGEWMTFRCPAGHSFVATHDDIKRDEKGRA